MLLDALAVRATVTATLSGLCLGVYTTLSKSTSAIVNHEVVSSPPIIYQVYAVPDRIHQILKPGGAGERITTQLLFASADNIPDDEDTTAASLWRYVDAQGRTHNVVAVNPTRPDGVHAVVYEIELAR